jgi:uncharacterized protein
MKSEYQEKIDQYLLNNKAIQFAYLFGSRARNVHGPLSDIDVAVYLDKRFDCFSARLRFLEELSRLLEGHPLDLVVLNTAPLVLKYEVLCQGVILKENKKRRIPFEAGVLREYFDTEPMRRVHVEKLKKSFSKERRLG